MFYSMFAHTEEINTLSYLKITDQVGRSISYARSDCTHNSTTGCGEGELVTWSTPRPLAKVVE